MSEFLKTRAKALVHNLKKAGSDSPKLHTIMTLLEENDSLTNAQVEFLTQIENLSDKLDAVSSELDACVEVCYNRGATEFVRLNYPSHFERLQERDKLKQEELKE